MTTILVVDDHVTNRLTLKMLIDQRFGYTVLEAEDGEQALEMLHKHRIDLVILDLFMPKKDGLETLEELRERDPDIPVILLTASHELEHAVKAMKLGAQDFQTKPIEAERFCLSVTQALKIRSMQEELQSYRRKEAGELHFDDMVGHDGGLAPVIHMARKTASSHLPVLISGETGTGKEVLARAIHGESKRAGKPFVAVNCGAIPPQLIESTLFGHKKGSFTGAITDSLGKFREAEGGTLFLDEIGELPLDAQVRLLRVLQEKEIDPVGSSQSLKVNVRIISATNRSLEEEVQKGSFREDLFFRINVLQLRLPALRERCQDIAALVQLFMKRVVASQRLSLKEISTQAMLLLEQYHWPGNVRELENGVGRLMVLSEHPVIVVPDVQALLSAQQSGGNAAEDPTLPTVSLLDSGGSLKPLKAIERAAIRFHLHYQRDNVTQAAISLGMAKPTLYRRMAEMKSDKA